jgi:phage-Barnase-EndoU-ColicinE5/D-RelE like nuclease2
MEPEQDVCLQPFDGLDQRPYPFLGAMDLGLSQHETAKFMYNNLMGVSPRAAKRKPEDGIVIDSAHGLVFKSEEDLYNHFAADIQLLEREFFALRSAEKDVPEESFASFDRQLDPTLDDPDEIWEDTESLADRRVFIYMRVFEGGVTHVAVSYLTEDTPSFVYLHFPTQDTALVEKYRRGQMVFHRSDHDVPSGALDGDALFEKDELAVGLYRAMLKLRSDKDIPESEFRRYADSRESTLEDADEIWRNADSLGNVLVSFVKEFNEGEDFHYIVVTIEDAPSGSHALLFSFPTKDKSLVDRYRHGDNLQAEEVVQESSH